MAGGIENKVVDSMFDSFMESEIGSGSQAEQLGTSLVVFHIWTFVFIIFMTIRSMRDYDVDVMKLTRSETSIMLILMYFISMVMFQIFNNIKL